MRPTMQPVSMVAPPAGMPAPQQQPNPPSMENQNTNPRPVAQSDQSASTPSKTENQNVNPRPVSQGDQSLFDPSNCVPVRPVAQPEQPASSPSKIVQPRPPQSNNDAVDRETSYPTYNNDELIAIEGNAAGIAFLKQMSHLMFILAQLYFHIIM